MRKIVITNDDGIAAEGLLRLVKVAKEFGEVLVVAPDDQRSASSHAITLRGHIDVYPYDYPVEGVKAYTCSGTPGDCVRIASVYLCDQKPDVLFSGINKGYNTATDAMYSGTVGAAFEGEFQGMTSIAFSEADKDCHEVGEHYLKELIEEYIDADPGPGNIININFPGCPLDECKGILRDTKLSRSAFYTDRYKKIEDLENDGERLVVDGLYGEECEEDTDMWAVVNKYVSVGIVKNYS